MAFSVFRGGPAFGEAGAFCGLRSYPMVPGHEHLVSMGTAVFFESRKNCGLARISEKAIGRPLDGRPMDSRRDMAGFVVNSHLHNFGVRDARRIRMYGSGIRAYGIRRASPVSDERPRYPTSVPDIRRASPVSDERRASPGPGRNQQTPELTEPDHPSSRSPTQPTRAHPPPP